MAYSKARRLSDLVSSTGEVSAFTDASIVPADLHATLDLTGKTITVATASASDNDTTVASTAFVQQELASLVDSAPGTLNTLNELAAALGDDASFSTTVTNSIATKLPLAGGVMTGNLDINGNQLILDADADTSFREGADDYIIMKIGGTDLIKIDSSGIGIGIRPAEMLDIQSSSGDARIRLDAPSGSDTEIKFFNDGSAQYTIGHDDATDNFVIGGANVDSPLVKINKSGEMVIGGDTSINRGNQTAGELLLGGTTDGGFVDFDGTSLQLNTQRDPNTGTFINTGKSNARIDLVGADGDAYIRFSTTASNNTSASEKMRIDKNGKLLIGHTANFENGLVQVHGTKSLVAGIPQGLLQVSDKTSMAAGVGGGINFTGQYLSDGTHTSFASIEASKTNGTSGNYGGDLVFKTRVHGGSQLERMRIHSTGHHVSIGATSLTTNFSPEAHLQVGTAGTGTRSHLQLSTATNGYPAIHFGDGSGAASYRGWVTYAHPDDSLTFGAAGAERMRILSGGGIAFNGDTAAANGLDDYEEGNFTPIFACAGGSAPSSQTGTGQYTKIGDVVHLTGQINWSGSGSGGVNMRIAIPFNVISDARAGMAIGLNSGVSYTSGHMLHMIPEINTNVIYLVSSPVDGSGHDHLNFSNVKSTGSTLFSFSGSYHTRD